MSEEIKNIPLTQNEKGQTFEMAIDGHIAFIEYEQKGNTIVLIHTEVPDALEGRGIGSALVSKTLAYIESKGQKIVPQCSFVASYIKRHPEWERLLQ